MQISEITAFLEQAYDVLNQHFFNGELSRVIITVQSSPKAYGTYTPWESWKDSGSQQGYKEINIGAESIDRPIENVIATLVHEMTHFYCDLQGIKDCSRGGTYHNKSFKKQAEEHGLIIEYDSRIGWSLTQPSESLIAFIEVQGWQGVSLARQGVLGPLGGKGGTKTSTRKYKCPECGISVRATKPVNIGCLDCGEQMELEEK